MDGELRKLMRQAAMLAIRRINYTLALFRSSQIGNNQRRCQERLA